MNDQRKAIFGQRLEIMEAEDLSEIVQDMRHQVIDDLVERAPAARSPMPTSGISQGLGAALREWTTLDLPLADWAAEEGVDQDVMRERIVEASDTLMAEKARGVRCRDDEDHRKAAAAADHRRASGASICCGWSICGRSWASAAMRSATR